MSMAELVNFDVQTHEEGMCFPDVTLNTRAVLLAKKISEIDLKKLKQLVKEAIELSICMEENK